MTNTVIPVDIIVTNGAIAITIISIVITQNRYIIILFLEPVIVFLIFFDILIIIMLFTRLRMVL